MANALSSADLALAGIRSVIPPDKVVDALLNVQKLLPMELRDTTLGGLGCTRTGLKLKQEWLERMKSEESWHTPSADSVAPGKGETDTHESIRIRIFMLAGKTTKNLQGGTEKC